MDDWFEIARSRRDKVAAPAIRAAIALSLLLHALLLSGLPQMRLASLDKPEWGGASRLLSVNLRPLNEPPAPVPAPALRTERSSAALLRRPAPAPGQPIPPAVAQDPPASDVSSPAPGTPAISRPSPAHDLAGGDLLSYIEAKRRARAESTATPSSGGETQTLPIEDDPTRRDRIIAANLGTQRVPAFGYDPARKGGAFQIQRVGYDDAEFIFYGWNKEQRRNMAQLVEVRKGSHADIRIAVVRRIIAIIRDFEQGDFLWESSRQPNNLVLSARPKDNAVLENFMMAEFFNDQRPPR